MLVNKLLYPSLFIGSRSKIILLLMHCKSNVDSITIVTIRRHSFIRVNGISAIHFSALKYSYPKFNIILKTKLLGLQNNTFICFDFCYIEKPTSFTFQQNYITQETHGNMFIVLCCFEQRQWTSLCLTVVKHGCHEYMIQWEGWMFCNNWTKIIFIVTQIIFESCISFPAA